MYNFILQTIIMTGLATIIYLFARAVPRVQDLVAPIRGRDYFGEFFDKLPLEKADAFMSMLLERFLRSLKVMILKLDNLLTNHLRSLRATAMPGKNEAVDQLFSSSAAGKSEGVEKQEKSDNLK